MAYPKYFFKVPFANSGNFTIPNDEQPALGRVSLPLGFPPETQKKVAEGGVAPSRWDMNGILHQLSAFAHWQQSGGMWIYNPAFAYSPPALIFYNNQYYSCVAPSGPGTGVAAVIPGSSVNYWKPFLGYLSETNNIKISSGGGLNTKTVITSSQTFWAPVDGYYLVTCIGAGGGGGRGGEANPRGGAGGSQGGATAFGGYLSAAGGSGGGGGGCYAGGGGGGAGDIQYNYVKLTAGTAIGITIGGGGAGGTATTSTYSGWSGGGPHGGSGSVVQMGGGGAPGASNGGNDLDKNRYPASGGAGAVNGSGYGGGGGGGSAGDEIGAGDHLGGAAKDGAEKGKTMPSRLVGGAGGRGGNGAVIIEYFRE